MLMIEETGRAILRRYKGLTECKYYFVPYISTTFGSTFWYNEDIYLCNNLPRHTPMLMVDP